MIYTQPSLKGKRVILEPLEDISYLVDLSDKDNKGLYPKEQLSNFVKSNGEFWIIYLDGIKRGVVGYFKINNIYILEALKDHSQPSTGISYSIEVGNVILDYIFELTSKVRTVAKIEDKAIQILCKKLGFKELTRKDNLIIYEKEK